MPLISVVGVSGSIRRPSRTTELVERIGRDLIGEDAVGFTLIDLCDIGPDIGAFSRDQLPAAGQDALATIEGADALIVGSPIYKGAYTGLFKHLFDFVDPASLVGKPVTLTATGGGRRHALALEHQFRSLFGFFSALSLPTAVYASDEDFQDGRLTDPVTFERVRRAASELRTQLNGRKRRAVAEPLVRAA